jgi:antitoxin VapB
MSLSTVFTKNRCQVVRLTGDTRFPDSVKKVEVRVLGLERIIAPADSTWVSFFLSGPMVSDDFMSELARQQQSERESL